MAELSLSAANHDRMIELRVGDTIVLKLNENPTTGYKWEFDPLEACLSTVSSEFVASQASGLGGGGIRTIKFRADGPGMVRLRLELRRPWEAERILDSRLQFLLEIKQ